MRIIDRIFSPWTVTRALYVVIGTAVLVDSTMSHQWILVVFGAYFAAMGLFAFGCASGQCSIPTKK